MRDIWKDNVFLLLGRGKIVGNPKSLENKMNYSPHTYTHTHKLFESTEEIPQSENYGLQILTNVVKSQDAWAFASLDAKQNDKNWGLLPLQS